MKSSKSALAIVLGIWLVLIVFTPINAQQPFPTPIQLAINALVTGVTPFTAFRTAASSYLNWGVTQGVNGYGIRDNAGTIEVKNSAGSWNPVPTSSSGAPTGASYLTRVAESGLSNETAIGGLATGLLINTTTTGIPTIYAGATCTNQFPRSISAIGALTCAAVSLTNDVSGTLPPANGGTGLTGGTSGGVVYFSSATTYASSAALAASRIVFGGGAATAPATGLGLGTTTTLLHGNAAGLPTWGAVSLTADVSGVLGTANGGLNNGFFAVTGPTTSTKTFTFPNASSTVLTSNAAVTAAQGGTGQTTYTIGDLIYASGAAALSKLAAVATGNVLLSGGTGTAPAWGKVGLTTHVAGILPPANGGTGLTDAVPLRRATVTLTDAQIKALPTTSISLVAAPGVNLRVKVLAATLYLNSSAGAYTNINATYASLWIGHSVSTYQTNDIANDSSVMLTRLTGFLGATLVVTADQAAPNVVAITGAMPNDVAYITNGVVAATASVSNLPLLIGVDNNGSGVLTGGNSANTLRVVVTYTLEQTP